MLPCTLSVILMVNESEYESKGVNESEYESKGNTFACFRFILYNT